MALFQDVLDGEAWRPEDAARHNAVNEVVNRLNGGGTGTATRLPGMRGAVVLPAVYTSDAALPAFTPVGFASGAAVANPADPADLVLTISGAAVSDSGLWGVTLGPVTSGGAVAVLIAGLTTVKLASGTEVAAGDFITPGSGGFVSGGSSAKVVAPPVSGGFCVALLGASGGSGVGEAQAYKVVQVPVGGVGVGLVQNIRFTGGGAGYETVGDPVPKFFCHIGGPLV